MALSKSEYFKNIFTTIVQSTGSIVNAQSPEEMRAFVRAAKIDAAINVRNWNKFVHPILKTLRSSPEHEYDVLDTVYGGVSGWTVTTELWATEDSMECLWDFTRGQPHSITGSILCLAAKIAALSADQDHEHEVYDDTSIKGLIECIELNLEQAKKDLFGECYVWDCDGNANLPYPLARHLHEIFKQVISGGPSLGLDGCFDGSYPALSIDILVSKFIYDILIPSTGVEYCTGTVSSAFQALEKYTGQTPCLDTTPDYSTVTPTVGASAGNLVLTDGDNLTVALKDIDTYMNIYSSFAALADGGAISGDPRVTASGPGNNLNFKAGPGISLELSNASTPSDDYIKISATGQQDSSCCTLQQSYDVGATTSGGLIVTNSTWPYDGSVIIEEDNDWIKQPTSYGLAQGVEIFKVRKGKLDQHEKLWGTGKHELFHSDAAGTFGSAVTHLQSTGVPAGPSKFTYYQNQSHENTVLNLRPVSNFTPDTLGVLHPNASMTSFPAGEQGALWVSNGKNGVPDRNGNTQQSGHLYYREPGGGDIWHLLCCDDSGSSANQNLGQTYNYDASGDGFADGGKIILDRFANTPGGIHIYDSPTTMTTLGDWLGAGLYNTPMFAIGKNNQSITAGDTAGYFSVGMLDGQTSVDEIIVNNHESPVNFSTRINAGDPATPPWQGSLYSKNVSVGASGGVEAHIHWRCPSSGTIYDLTNTGSGGGGGAGQAWRSILLNLEAGTVGSSVSGDGTAESGVLAAGSISTLLNLRAGNYIGIRGQDGGDAIDIINLSVNPMPTTFLSDVCTSITATADQILYWNDADSEYAPGPAPIGVQAAGSAVPSSFGAPFLGNAVTRDGSGRITSNQLQFRRLVAGANISIAHVGSGGKDIQISADLAPGSGATKTTELTDVDSAAATITGSILTWDNADSEYDPAAIVNVGAMSPLYAGYDATSLQHQFRSLSSTTTASPSVETGEALKWAYTSELMTLQFHPSELDLDDFGDVATGADYPTSGADDGAILVWDATAAKWKKEERTQGTASLWLRPNEWDQLSVDTNRSTYFTTFHPHDGVMHSHPDRNASKLPSITPRSNEYGDDITPDGLDGEGLDLPGGYTGERVDDSSHHQRFSERPMGTLSKAMHDALGHGDGIKASDYTSLWSNHNDNRVLRMPYEPRKEESSLDHASTSKHSWDAIGGRRSVHNHVVHNGLQFNIMGNQGVMIDYESQSIFCTFATPAVYKNAAWDTHFKMRCTAYFVGPGDENMSGILGDIYNTEDPDASDPFNPWNIHNTNTVSYRLSTLHDTGSGRTNAEDAADLTGKPTMLVDGMQLTQSSFGANAMTDCFKTGTTTHINKHRQVSVVEFDAITLTGPDQPTPAAGTLATKDPGGLITVRLTPTNGQGLFNHKEETGTWTDHEPAHHQNVDLNETIPHYFLGMRVDFY